ncbi:MAG: Gfo/Idh/MocA family oxidoreductase [Verrucomicrobia bacterium]|nr:Gfo/Idh/MocA family oxidoreductase [Verrucomicrobiota bacterium]
MSQSFKKQIFDANQRIRLGIWGLGRGGSFYRACRALCLDVVAGCDYNRHMRDNFLAQNPGAFVTENAEEFLARDFDAVLLATFCPAHADDAIACLNAGKHVLSEVTSFHTMAEGVRLVETVEKTGKIYNLAENYPFSAPNMWLARRWKDGFFGELMYAEYEYVHEVRTLAYTYIDNTPIIPGNHAHSWRSWINYHYYNTHSLGPMMHITGLRPTRVVALPGQQRLSGYLMRGIEGMGGVAPSLINMSNGAIVRNLMGATTNDGHCQRIWGTKGAAQMTGHGLQLRLGGSGDSPMFEVNPQWDELGELAAATGHSGGDFWVLYFFARQILEGAPAPFEIYAAADCTIPGILAYRSQIENGKAYNVPDFRDPAQREPYRNDHYAQPRYDSKNGLFPKGADESITLQFSRTMRDLINASGVYRAYRDWSVIAADVKDPTQLVPLADRLLEAIPLLQETQRTACKIVEAYPESDGARVLRDMLERSDVEITSRPGFARDLRRERGRLARRGARWLKCGGGSAESETDEGPGICSPFVRAWRLSRLTPKRGGTAGARCVKLSDPLDWRDISDSAVATGAPPDFINVHQVYPFQDGIAYLGNRFKVAKDGVWTLLLGHDGGCKVFVNGKAVFCNPQRMNPAEPDRSRVVLKLAKGVHEIVVALDTDHGLGWGIFFRFQIPREARPKGWKPLFPMPMKIRGAMFNRA